MKRLVIFVVAGPIIGLATMVLPVMVASAQVPTLSSLAVLGHVLPYVYMLGVVPALAAGVIDGQLAKFLAPLLRIVFTGIAVAILCAASFALFGFSGLLGLGAAGPAMICSWLSSDKEAAVALGTTIRPE